MNKANLNFEKIDNPYDYNLNRANSDIFSVGGQKFNSEGLPSVDTSEDKSSDSKQGLGAGSVHGGNSNVPMQEDLWISNWIKSRNYKPKSQGFLIDGKLGYIECMKLYVGTGGIVGGSLDIPDTTTTNSFHVDTSGLLWAGANVVNKATAPVRINPTGEITLGNPSGVHLQLSGPNKRIRSSNYVAGDSGFSLDSDLLEVGNIIARGAIKTSNFIKGNITSVGGHVMVSKGSDTLDVDMTTLDASTLTIKGNDTFAVNDILRIKEDTDDEWFQVTNIGSAPTYTVTRDKASVYSSNSNPAWKKGATVVNYGQSGQGFIEMAAAETNNPWMKVKTHTGSPWSTTTTVVNIGQLKDQTGSDEYGVWIKSGASYIAGYRLYEAVVDAGGNGDYALLSDAIAAGKKRIFVRGGTYNETGNIAISSDTIIVGENPESTVINLGTYKISTTAEASPYTTGTVTFTQDSATVTGSGTTWSGNIAANDYIRNDNTGEWYQILTVDGNTQITLKKNYRGNTQAGVNYRISTLNNNITFNRLKFSSSSGSSVYSLRIESIISLIISECHFVGGNGAIYGNEVVYGKILNNIVKDLDSATPNEAIYFTESNHNIISNNFINNKKNSSKSSIVLDSNCTYNLLIDNSSTTSAAAGLEVKYSSNYNRISNNSFTGNLSYGINIDSSYNTIIGNQCTYNTTAGIILTSSNAAFNTLTGNNCSYSQGTGSGVGGIVVQGNNNILQANICNRTVSTNAQSAGILVITADRNVIDGNLCHNNGQAGIRIDDAGSLNNIISNNVCLNNTSAQITDNGTTTVNDNNVTA